MFFALFLLQIWYINKWVVSLLFTASGCFYFTTSAYSFASCSPFKILAVKKTTLQGIFSGLLILLFIYTSINKLANLAGFEEVLSKSPLLSLASWPAAVLIPVMEIVVSALLFFPSTQRIGFLFSLLMMTCFTIYIGGMLAFASKLPCSCGGVLSELTWKEHLFFNLFFVFVSAYGYRLTGSSGHHPNHMSPQ